MPTYICTTCPDRLRDDQRAAIARAMSRAHAAATGAPAYFVQVVFEERPHRFIGGEPAERHIMVRGDIRAGRSAATRTALARTIAGEVAGVADAPLDEVWVYLDELQPGDMVEFGHVLPEPGGEQAWYDALPHDLRETLRALERRQADR